MSTLPEAFLALATRHGADDATARAWWREVESRYAEPHRRYHTIEHIRELLGLLPEGSDEVLAAVTAAQNAFPAWSSQGPGARRAKLNKAADLLEARAADFAARLGLV